MNTRAVMKQGLKRCDRKEVAMAMGISIGALNNQVSGQYPYQPVGHTPNYLDRIVDMVDAIYNETGSMLIVEKLAEEFGFFLVQDPASMTEAPAMEAVSHMLQEFGELIETASKAHADGDISKCEAADIRKEWEDVKKAGESFVNMCEAGMYSLKGE